MVYARGNSFQCTGCDATLTVAKLSRGTTLLFVFLGIMAVQSLDIPFVVVMLVTLAAAIVEWAVLKVYLDDE